MILQERFELLEKLGKYILSNNENWQMAKERASRENPWFIADFIEISSKNIAEQFLQKTVLEAWAMQYDIRQENIAPKNVGVVMAGNIPLVGFHDFLCVFLSGNDCLIKASSKDEVLIKHLITTLYSWEVTVQNKVSFAQTLKGCDAYIATGSNNSSRYFEYYFGKYPSIIRKNKTSVAILEGTESNEQLKKLADDIQLYFGLGCRNVTKLYVPVDYNFIALLEALKKYEHFMSFHKYKHNYDYYLALLIMNNKFYMTDGSLLLTENEALFTPVAQINYSYYTDLNQLKKELIQNADIQCITGENFVAFGSAQSPSLSDYADDVDTIRFLKSL